nr:hypothetical protein [Tanacetum cinerariifolium]
GTHRHQAGPFGHGAFGLLLQIGGAVQRQHRHCQHAAQQAEGIQQVEEAARVFEAQHVVVFERHTLQQVAEGDAEDHGRDE